MYKIQYDRQRLEKIVKHLNMMSPEGKAGLTGYLNAIDQEILEIEKCQAEDHLEDFYPAMQNAVRKILNIADEIYKLTVPYHEVFPTTLRNKIIEWVTPLEYELKQLVIPEQDRKDVITKTKKLYAEQSFIVRQPDLKQVLIKHLTKLKQLFMKPGKTSPICRISYAWPCKDKPEEYWVQPFLLVLYDHLKFAGITVVMDICDNKPGDSIYQYMKKYHDGNYIILIGTESLLQKHYGASPHAVQTELNIIQSRFKTDREQRSTSLIYPMLISGTIETGYPEWYQMYSTVRDLRDQGYIGALQSLIDFIYKPQIAVAKEWQEFRQQHKHKLELSNNLTIIEQEISYGYHKHALTDLKGKHEYISIMVQQEAEHSPAVVAEIAAVYEASQGVSSENWYDFWSGGKQFQRPPTNPDFIKRQKLLDGIKEHFVSIKSQILTLTAHGLGGVGKTELAQYFYLHPYKLYTLRAWFNANSKEQVYQQYIDLASENEITFNDDIPTQEKIKRIINWLNKQKDCLLIYDDVPNKKEIDGLLPEQGKHHILITSRNEVDWPVHQSLDVDIMEEEEAIALICKITGRHEKDDEVPLKQLVKELGCLPLALAQAGAYITAKSWSVEKYLKFYRKHKSKWMNDDTVARHPKHEPVWITFDMNFKALTKECPAALMTLKQASWLNGQSIPQSLLRSMINSTDENKDSLWGDIKEHVKRYSLVKIDISQDTFKIHNLVQDILREQQEVTEKIKIFKQVCDLVNLLLTSSIEAEQWFRPENKNLFSHAEQLYHNRRNLPIERKLQLEAIPSNLGKVYQKMGLASKAFNFYTKQLNLYKENEKNSIQFSITLHNLGKSLNGLGKYSDAKFHLEDAKKIVSNLGESDSALIQEILIDLVSAKVALGELHSSISILKKVLKFYKKRHGDNDLKVAEISINLAAIYGGIGNPKDQKKLLKYALRIYKDISNDDMYPKLSKLYTCLGMTYWSLGKNIKAEKFLQEALKFNELCYGDSHPYVANTLTNLGLVYNSLQKYHEAKNFLKRSIKIKKNHYGKTHPEIAIPLTCLGDTLVGLKDARKAKKILKKALSIKEQFYGKEHLEVGITLGSLGLVGNKKQKYYYDKAYKIIGNKDRCSYSEGHPLVKHIFMFERKRQLEEHVEETQEISTSPKRLRLSV